MDEYYSNGKLKFRYMDETMERYYDNENNSIKEQSFFDGDDTAIETREYYESGNIMKCNIYGNSPSDIEYYESGNIKSQIYKNVDEELHKDDAPAEIYYYDNGNIKFYSWCLNGKKHRIGEISEECFNKDGKNVYKAFYVDGKLHNDNDYAEWKFDHSEIYDEDYDEENSMEDEYRHSEFGWYRNGDLYKKEIYKNDKKISEKIINGNISIETEYDEDEEYISSISYKNGNESYYEQYNEGLLYSKEIINGNYSIKEYYDNGIINCKMWLYENNLYRENDLPTIETYDISGNITEKQWKYITGYFRFGDLPSIEKYDGSGNIIEKHWYKNNVKHRDIGFAVEYANGTGEIWTDGVRKIDFGEYIGNESCSVCYELKNEMIITRCRHIFCKTCMHSWMRDSNDTCPYCRQKM